MNVIAVDFSQRAGATTELPGFSPNIMWLKGGFMGKTQIPILHQRRVTRVGEKNRTDKNPTASLNILKLNNLNVN